MTFASHVPIALKRHDMRNLLLYHFFKWNIVLVSLSHAIKDGSSNSSLTEGHFKAADI